VRLNHEIRPIAEEQRHHGEADRTGYQLGEHLFWELRGFIFDPETWSHG
jgi:hypothetical protein